MDDRWSVRCSNCHHRFLAPMRATTVPCPQRHCRHPVAVNLPTWMRRVLSDFANAARREAAG